MILRLTPDPRVHHRYIIANRRVEVHAMYDGGEGEAFARNPLVRVYG
jgi:hypothetical protein